MINCKDSFVLCISSLIESVISLCCLRWSVCRDGGWRSEKKSKKNETKVAVYAKMSKLFVAVVGRKFTGATTTLFSIGALWILCSALLHWRRAERRFEAYPKRAALPSTVLHSDLHLPSVFWLGSVHAIYLFIYLR